MLLKDRNLLIVTLGFPLLFLIALIVIPLIHFDVIPHKLTYYAYGSTTNNTSNSSFTNLGAQLSPKKNLSLSELFNNIKGSVVQVNARFQTFNPHILIHGSPFSFTSLGSGSGFIYDSDGHIVTNDHVVIGASTIDVRFLDGNSYSARIIGEDVYSDLAVLQLEPGALYREQMHPLPLANSSNIQVGQQVFAIGNPLGLTGSMTQGIVSQTDRILSDANTGKFYVSGLIQTDAPITHGNSGGPLLNLDGQVIGVTERGQPSAEEPALSFPGINFAIPSNTVQKVVPQLLAHGDYKHPWLGVHVIDITSDIAKQLGLNEAKGVIVIGVTPGSPAERAGINAGKNTTVIDFQQLNSDADIIVGIDQKPVREISDLINYVDSKSPGDNLTLKMFRSDGIIHDINIKLAQRPSAISQNQLGFSMNATKASMAPFLNQSASQTTR